MAGDNEPTSEGTSNTNNSRTPGSFPGSVSPKPTTQPGQEIAAPQKIQENTQERAEIKKRVEDLFDRLTTAEVSANNFFKLISGFEEDNAYTNIFALGRTLANRIDIERGRLKLHKETPITINITKEVEVGTKSIESDLESIYDKVNMIMRGIQPEANQEADLQPYVDRFSIAMNKIEAYEANSKSRRKLRSSLATLINPLKWLGEDPLLEQPGMDETKINDALDRLETALITYGASLEKVGGATSTTQEVEPKKETINIALERTTALKSFATTYSTLDARVRNLREKVKPALLGLIFDLGQELSFLQRKNDDGALSTTDIALKLSKLEKEIAELEKEPQEEETQPAAVEPITVNPPSPQSTQEEQKENISPKVHSLEIGTSNVVPNGRGGYSLEREGGRRNGKDLISLEEQKKWDPVLDTLVWYSRFFIEDGYTTRDFPWLHELKDEVREAIETYDLQKADTSARKLHEALTEAELWTPIAETLKKYDFFMRAADNRTAFASMTPRKESLMEEYRAHDFAKADLLAQALWEEIDMAYEVVRAKKNTPTPPNTPPVSSQQMSAPAVPTQTAIQVNKIIEPVVAPVLTPEKSKRKEMSAFQITPENIRTNKETGKVEIEVGGLLREMTLKKYTMWKSIWETMVNYRSFINPENGIDNENDFYHLKTVKNEILDALREGNFESADTKAQELGKNLDMADNAIQEDCASNLKKLDAGYTLTDNSDTFAFIAHKNTARKGYSLYRIINRETGAWVPLTPEDEASVEEASRALLIFKNRISNPRGIIEKKNELLILINDYKFQEAHKFAIAYIQEFGALHKLTEERLPELYKPSSTTTLETPTEQTLLPIETKRLDKQVEATAAIREIPYLPKQEITSKEGALLAQFNTFLSVHEEMFKRNKEEYLDMYANKTWLPGDPTEKVVTFIIRRDILLSEKIKEEKRKETLLQSYGGEAQNEQEASALETITRRIQAIQRTLDELEENPLLAKRVPNALQEESVAPNPSSLAQTEVVSMQKEAQSVPKQPPEEPGNISDDVRATAHAVIEKAKGKIEPEKVEPIQKIPETPEVRGVEPTPDKGAEPESKEQQERKTFRVNKLLDTLRKFRPANNWKTFISMGIVSFAIAAGATIAFGKKKEGTENAQPKNIAEYMVQNPTSWKDKIPKDTPDTKFKMHAFMEDFTKNKIGLSALLKKYAPSTVGKPVENELAMMDISVILKADDVPQFTERIQRSEVSAIIRGLETIAQAVYAQQGKAVGDLSFTSPNKNLETYVREVLALATKTQ